MLYLLVSCLCTPASARRPELLAMPVPGNTPTDWAQKVAAMALATVVPLYNTH
jgi:hypothetical protein